MKRLTLVVCLIPGLCIAADVQRLYVAGDSEAAIETRRMMSKAARDYENRACFDLMDEAKAADLTLKIGERESPSGINALLGSMLPNTVVTGQLMDRAGKIVWEDARQGAAGLTHDGAGAGARNLLKALWKSQGCSKDGRR